MAQLSNCARSRECLRARKESNVARRIRTIQISNRRDAFLCHLVTFPECVRHSRVSQMEGWWWRWRFSMYCGQRIFSMCHCTTQSNGSIATVQNFHASIPLPATYSTCGFWLALVFYWLPSTFRADRLSSRSRRHPVSALLIAPSLFLSSLLSSSFLANIVKGARRFDYMHTKCRRREVDSIAKLPGIRK